MSDKPDWDIPEVNDGRVISSKMVRNHRISICKKCPELTELLMCKQCNCFMPVATWIQPKKCKIGKW